MIDSHVHLLSERYDEDREQLLKDLPGLGITAAIEAGVDVAYCKEAQALCERVPYLYFLAGIHPHDAADTKEDYLAELRTLTTDKKCVGIGEIGLDYYYEHSPRDIQMDRFDAQMALAEELGLPVCIHSRDATAPTLDMLKKYAGKVMGVMHCYSGSVESAKVYLNLGYYISIAGPVTFKNAAKLPEVAKMVPVDRLLVETDCPYLAPVPKRGKRNQPDYVRYTMEYVAQLRDVSFEALEQQTEENTKRLYQRMVD
ncbi:TatD family hydrolase [Eubacteriales bacterium OttesenSCG-928-M02]|nr:TatD family hydrolase [Eubacteriales bacterium OttesenSCG-928-M02]